MAIWGARGRKGNNYRRFFTRAVFGLTASNPPPKSELWDDLYFSGGVEYLKTLVYSAAGSLDNVKSVSKLAQYTSNTVESIVKSIGKLSQYTSNTVESTVKVINKTNKYTIATSEGLIKIVNKTIDLTSTIVNTITAVGIFGGIIFNKTLSYVATASETLTRSINKVNGYSVSKSATQTKAIGKPLTLVNSVGSPIVRLITKPIALLQTKSYTVSKRTSRLLNYTLSNTITLLKVINKALAYAQMVEQSIVTLYINGGFVQAFQKMVALFRFGNIETRHELAVEQRVSVVIDSISSDQLDQFGNINLDQLGQNAVSQDYGLMFSSSSVDCVINTTTNIDCTPNLTNDNYILDQAGNNCLTQANANLII